jgi:hypothetical protein
MTLLQKINPIWPLRIGFGLMYIYSGYSLVVHPTSWLWALRGLPQSFQLFINNQVGASTYLIGQGIGELVLAFIFLAWFLPIKFLKLATILAILELVVIILLIGIDPITFRDIGLLSAVLSLLILISVQKNK